MPELKNPIFENDEIKVYKLLDSDINFFDTSVPCGEPEPCGEVPMETVKAYELLDAGKDEAYAVEIKGYSMVDADLEPGDTAIINTNKEAEKGDIVLAFVNGEPYVKYLFIDDDGRVWLVPANKSFQPKCYTAEDNVHIKGVLSRVIKDKTKGNARLLGKLDKLCQEQLAIMQEGDDRVSAFEELMCCSHKKDKLKKMHELIDGKKGVYVARVIKVAWDMCFFSKGPTYKQVKEEFGDIGAQSSYYNIIRNKVYEDDAKPIREYLS